MAYERVGGLERSLLVLLIGLTITSFGLFIGQVVMPQALSFAGLTVDRLNASIALLVAGVGTVAYRFALRYMDGEPRQRFFLRWLAATVLFAYIFIYASNLLVMFAVWFLTSLGLHQLLTYYRNRAEAYPPARKKFLISRLGDLALLAAIGLIVAYWGTLDLNEFLARLNEPVAWAAAPTVIALLIVVAALTKSAQFPFHSWLPETMEAPTPVSALMHAGIINAGGVLLLHFAPLLVQVPLALFQLALVGTLTAVLGLLAMWAQTNVKRTLAWSTVSQMGFMMIQFGVAAFPAATLHLLGHGCYKAWSFLRTGDLPRKTVVAPKLAPSMLLGVALLGVGLAIPALALAALVTGFDPFHSPGELALSAVVVLAIGQLWVAIFQAPRAPGSTLALPVMQALLGTLAAAFIAFGLYNGAIIFFAPVLGEVVVLSNPLAWASAILPVVAFTLLAALQVLLPLVGRSAVGRALYVHALHGFYLGVIADRLVEKVWGQARIKEVENA
ncbi:proton-conducting transporter membrane subunit [Candidatus Chloroploca sp. Khr17]|uniref:proton-conducting transporter transmembrane domain-containing protein n=1 Tax=Candidatus Chloroploca sp. Khr17 TaxID=2496869 RepID=UPI0013ED9EA5|nr:proton-conducting transporter membrane subunit [Candidatus Chloroploca sp. Khr17]